MEAIEDGVDACLIFPFTPHLLVTILVLGLLLSSILTPWFYQDFTTSNNTFDQCSVSATWTLFGPTSSHCPEIIRNTTEIISPTCICAPPFHFERTPFIVSGALILFAAALFLVATLCALQIFQRCSKSGIRFVALALNTVAVSASALVMIYFPLVVSNSFFDFEPFLPAPHSFYGKEPTQFGENYGILKWGPGPGFIIWGVQTFLGFLVFLFHIRTVFFGFGDDDDEISALVPRPSYTHD